MRASAFIYVIGFGRIKETQKKKEKLDGVAAPLDGVSQVKEYV